MNVLGSYKAEVLEIHSGDDLTLMVDLGIDNLHKRVRCRLRGVDTPDAFKAEEDSDAIRIKGTVETRLKGKLVVIDVHRCGRGGWVVTMKIPMGNGKLQNINDMLMSMGYVYERKAVHARNCA